MTLTKGSSKTEHGNSGNWNSMRQLKARLRNKNLYIQRLF